MQRVMSMDNTGSLPASGSGSYSPGYFQDGNAAMGQKGTVVPAEWANGVQEELITVISNAGITPSVNDNSQLYQALRKMIVNTCYPVGSYYISENNTSPATLFGFGTWVQVTGRFIVAAGGGYAAGNEYGAATVTLNTNHLPAHTHTATCASGGAIAARTLNTENDGGHAHTISVQANTHTHAKSSVTVSSVADHRHDHGTYEITGTLKGDNEMIQSATGCFVDQGSVSGRGAGNDDVCRKLLFKASNTWSGYSGKAGSHAHNVSIAASGSHTHTAACSIAAAHRHSITVPATADHAHTVTIASTGKGQSFSIIPPCRAAYVWRRTA